MYKIINRLPQPINLIIDSKTEILQKYETKTVNEITHQIKNLSNRGFIRICKVKDKEN